MHTNSLTADTNLLYHISMSSKMARERVPCLISIRSGKVKSYRITRLYIYQIQMVKSPKDRRSRARFLVFGQSPGYQQIRLCDEKSKIGNQIEISGIANMQLQAWVIMGP